ncbi:type II toxin-antitoxin system prevent-host-death family antitoxin [Ancylobacter sp. 6x-1]|uniref:Type II toxin-antitoxin system prevent-host-death family antitoxin n=1 Tax=Ancylobacter crimeensis TaxID=2579147 RepID=A0ABT0DBQ1_9HYPH|nr:type II toxin-antitoxin system prevent-host-death family antitoxin [Ancylobacter crimeensis]MCK0197369.1 type II toxin-antitoxin system prevent-host-death family antitoxin [Ancylobacter crimeensis]
MERRSHTLTQGAWTIAEAKARLSELLRRVERDGPQRIGTRQGYMVVSEAEWQRLQVARPPLGQWLRMHLPQGEALELPARDEPDRPNPFAPDEAV